jgi:hypothetical protein
MRGLFAFVGEGKWMETLSFLGGQTYTFSRLLLMTQLLK